MCESDFRGAKQKTGLSDPFIEKFILSIVLTRLLLYSLLSLPTSGSWHAPLETLSTTRKKVEDFFHCLAPFPTWRRRRTAMWRCKACMAGFFWSCEWDYCVYGFGSWTTFLTCLHLLPVITLLSYKTKAKHDVQEVSKIVEHLLESLGLASGSISLQEIESFCKYSAFLKVIRYRSLEQEYNQHKAQQIGESQAIQLHSSEPWLFDFFKAAMLILIGFDH